MRAFRLLSETPKLPFMAFRKLAFIVSGAAAVFSVVLALTIGLNFGIDFRGGTLIEVRTADPVDIGGMRQELGALGLGDVQLQEFGQPTDVLIRIERQPGDVAAQSAAVDIVRDALIAAYGEVTIRRSEFVGPKVSEELFAQGVWAVTLALLAILVYVWFRFEWQFGVGAVLALAHDVILTIGLFSLFQLEFNLATVAALLTIVGYSLNDTVVVFDRVRENLRKYRKMDMSVLLDRSLNETLARTIVTAVTTLLALVALFVIGGEVIQGFTLAMIWGVIVGTYSTLMIASPVLLYMKLRRESDSKPEVAETSEDGQSA